MTDSIEELRAILQYKHGRLRASEALKVLRRGDGESLQHHINAMTLGWFDKPFDPEEVVDKHLWRLRILVRVACGQCSTGRALGLLEVDANTFHQILEEELNGKFCGRGVSTFSARRSRDTRGETPQEENTMTEKTAAIEGLHDIETLAASKAIASKIASTARDNVEPGQYDVSFDLHVEGTVTVGEDYEQKIVNKAQPWNIIAALLEENARVAEAAGETGVDINKLIKAAEAMDPDLVKRAKAQAEDAAAALKATTLTQAKGKVTVKLTATPLAN